MEYDLYDMDLGEVRVINNGYDRHVRVPGGWVHTIMNKVRTKDYFEMEPSASCFIPEEYRSTLQKLKSVLEKKESLDKS